MSSLRRGHANLLCIVPILVYVMPKQTQSVMGSVCLINLWTFWKLVHVVLSKKKNRNFFFSFLKEFRWSGKKKFCKIFENFLKFFLKFFFEIFEGGDRVRMANVTLWCEFVDLEKKKFEKFSKFFWNFFEFFFFTFEGDERVRRSPLSQIVRSSYPRLG